MEGINLKITGTFKGQIDRIKEILPRAERRALYTAAVFLRDKIKQSLISAVPKATMSNSKYNDTLADAVRFTRIDGMSLKVHALGTRQSGSGTFRARFFESGTKERYQKTFNGVKLNKKRRLGKINATNFFSSAVESNRSAVLQIIENEILKYIDIANKNR